jgi:nucleotide-binding universal stress UspA family protein
VARATGAELVLLRVLPPGSPEPNESTTAAQAELDRCAQELAAEHLRVRTIVQHDEPIATAILEAVREQGADLVVMATHGRVGLARIVLGSVAQAVVAESPVPVLLTRPDDRPVTRLNTLLVPVDSSPGSTLALGAAVPLARATGARIVLLQVVVPWITTSLSPWLLIDPNWDEDVRAGAQQYVQSLAARLQRAGLNATGEVVSARSTWTGLGTTGHITEQIVEAAENVDADLVVMSTHAHTGPLRSVLGSVTDEVVRTGRRPVLVLRRSEGSDAEAAQ